MDINQIVEAFFDSSRPCPIEILECEQLRAKYNEEVDNLNKQGCSQCQKNSIKSKYLEDVWKKAISTLTQKDS